MVVGCSGARLVINRIEIKNHEKEFNIILHIVSRPLPGIFL